MRTFESYLLIVSRNLTMMKFTSANIYSRYYTHAGKTCFINLLLKSPLFSHLCLNQVFLGEEVDAVIMEVGLGGRYDCTNVLPAPFVCGITSLGLG